MAEGPQLFEWRAEDRGGRRFWVEINLTLTSLGGRDRLLAVIRDISERKQVEDIRRRAYEELEQLVAERTAGLQSANAQLRGEIEERRRTEAIIRLQRDLALTLSGKVGLQETLRLCLETAITISGLDSGGVYLVDPASGDLDLAYHQGLSPSSCNGWRITRRTLSIPTWSWREDPCMRPCKTCRESWMKRTLRKVCARWRSSR